MFSSGAVVNVACQVLLPVTLGKGVRGGWAGRKSHAVPVCSATEDVDTGDSLEPRI